jgi:glycosyltransferase involved in cell wall biosynthesis
LWLTKGKIYEQLRNVDVDLYYTLSDFWSQEVARYLALKSSKPYVVRLRGDHKATREAKTVPYYKRKIVGHYEIRSLREADLIIPISKRLANIGKNWGIDKSKITEPVLSGIDSRHFKPMNVNKSNKFTIGYAGRISQEKGIDRLIELARKLPNLPFLVAGAQEMEVNFPDNVHYKGKLPFSEMPNFYNQCDIMIILFNITTEGIGLLLLEAYACGKPILAISEASPLRFNGDVEIVDSGGHELKIFGKVGRFEDFPLFITELKDLDLVSIGKQARTYVQETFSWEKFGESITKHLKILCGEKIASKRDA